MKSTFQQPYNEAALLTSLKSGQPKAFQELYDRFAFTFYNRLVHLVRDQQHAEDLLQDSFIKIYANVQHFDSSKGRLFSWMKRIVQNTAFDHLAMTKLDRKSIHSNFPEELQADSPSYDGIGVRGWLDSTLCVKQRQMIELVYYQGYTQQEIAAELGLPLGTVKTRIRTALIRLREAEAYG